MANHGGGARPFTCRKCGTSLGTGIPKLSVGNLKGGSFLCIPCVSADQGKLTLDIFVKEYIAVNQDPVRRLRFERDELKAQNERLQKIIEDLKKEGTARYK